MSTTLTQQDLERYGDVLAEIQARVDYAWSLLEDVSERFDLEAAAMHLRTAIELIAFATLAVNRQSLEEISSVLHKADWSAARKLLKRANPQFWPVPYCERIDANGPRAFVQITEPYLEEANAGAEWGFLSTFVHAENPLSPLVIEAATVERMRAIATRIRNLLSVHTADLGGSQRLVLGEMDPPDGGAVLVQVLNAAGQDGAVLPSGSG